MFLEWSFIHKVYIPASPERPVKVRYMEIGKAAISSSSYCCVHTCYVDVMLLLMIVSVYIPTFIVVTPLVV